VARDGSGFGTFVSEKTESGFNFYQPVFGGFREFAAIAGSKAQRRAAEARRIRSETLLLGAVSQVFYEILQQESLVRDTQAVIKLSEDRVKELRGRIRLGKSRDSELTSAEAQLASEQARESRTLSAVQTSRDFLSYYTGVDVSQTQLVESLQLPATILSEEEAIARSSSRSDLRALEEEVYAANQLVRYARSGHYPTLSLGGNYYLERPGLLDEIKWDASINVGFPIYKGGAVSALVREEEARLRQSELLLEQRRRQIARDVKHARRNVLTSIDQARLLETGYQQARRSYELQVKEYRLGLVTNLDVIVSLNSAQTFKENRDSANYQKILDWLSLQIAMGDIPSPEVETER
jgi:outer membrane protein